MCVWGGEKRKVGKRRGEKEILFLCVGGPCQHHQCMAAKCLHRLCMNTGPVCLSSCR